MERVIVPYRCSVDAGINTGIYVGINDITLKSFREKVHSVLNDPRGWNKYGYYFREIHSDEANSGRINAGALHIILVTGDKAKRKCGSALGGFSCYSSGENIIYMNLDNWMGGSKSSLPLDRYRTYAVNHEVGHRLGIGHPSESNCSKSEYCKRAFDKTTGIGAPGSVMVQMTRGPDWVYPCVENEWPLDPNIYNEVLKNPRLDNEYPVPIPRKISHVGGAGISRVDVMNTLSFALVILIILVIILAAATSIISGLRRYPHVRSLISN